MNITVREYRPQDLGRVIQLWERAGWAPLAPDGLTVDQAVDLLGFDPAVTLVAEIAGEIVGMATGTVSAAVGSVHRVAVLPDSVHESEVADRLLDQLELSLASAGARKLGALAAAGPVRESLERHDYRARDGVAYLEREVPAAMTVPTSIAEGRVLPPGLWDELKGLEEAKGIIERRVILPLAERELASRHAVSPPKAIVLFGPPGTGKTTFAKGIASRLGWPFAEIHAAELVGDSGEGEARLLAQAFDRMSELPAAVVFVDEVEDLASARQEERRVSPSVTNEFLRQVPRLRETPEHLLVCATNWVDRLDPAFLRPGRFDYVLPVGPPDRTARAAIWRRYAEEITDEDLDLEELVTASELFTPADIEFAARKAAQRAFEREHFEQVRRRAGTEDFLAAISETRPTLSKQVVEGFAEQTRSFARY